jgi:ABC-type uncharacterized transport system substrate-binding protein
LITKKTKELVVQACKEELRNAKSFGEFYNSPHEAYAILKEEIEETKDNLSLVEKRLENIWQNIKDNDDEELVANILTLKSYALLTVFEAVQVCAVSEKFKESF